MKITTKHKVRKERDLPKGTGYFLLGVFALLLCLYVNFCLVTDRNKPNVFVAHAEAIVAPTETVTPTMTMVPTTTVIPTVEPTKAPEKTLTIEEKICKAFGDKCKDALLIAQKESGIRSIRSYKANSNGSYDWGIFQINQIHCNKLGLHGDCSKLLDVDTNIEMAVLISGKGTTWKAWSTCKYLPKCY